MSVCACFSERPGLKLESSSRSADRKPDVLMALYRNNRVTVSTRVPGLTSRLSRSSGIWTNCTNRRAGVHLASVCSQPVSLLSSGYRGAKGERGQLGFGLPGDPGEMGPPGKKTCLKHDYMINMFLFFLVSTDDGSRQCRFKGPSQTLRRS